MPCVYNARTYLYVVFIALLSCRGYDTMASRQVLAAEVPRRLPLAGGVEDLKQEITGKALTFAAGLGLLLSPVRLL